MSNIINMVKPNNRIVELLENLLTEAKQGRISSLAAIVLRDHEADFSIEVPELNTLEVIGALEILKQELITNH